MDPDSLHAILADDHGFRSLLNGLSEAEQLTIAQVLSDPSLLSRLYQHLPPADRNLVQQQLHQAESAMHQALALFRQSRFSEARELLLQTIEEYRLPGGLPQDDPICKAASFVVVRVQALCHDLLGSIASTLGNTSQAGSYYEQARTLARECGDQDTEAKALYGLGCYHFELGDYQQALDFSNQCVTLLEGTPDRWSNHCKALNTISLIHGELGDQEQATIYSERAITLAEERGDLQIISVMLSNRAAQLTDQGRLDEIPPLLEQALAACSRLGDIRQEAFVRRNLGMQLLNTASSDGDLHAAQEQFQQALRLSRESRDVGLEALCCSGLGHTLISQEDYDAAEEQYRRAVELQRSIGARSDCAAALRDLGNLLRFGKEQLHDALTCYQEAIELIEQSRSLLRQETHRIGFANTRTEPYHQAITTLLELGRPDDAFHYLERSRSMALLELLSGTFLEQAADGPVQEAAQLAARIEELRATLEDTDSNNDQPSRSKTRDRLHQKLAEQEQTFARLCAGLQQTAPEKLGLLTVEATSHTAVQQLLPSDTALLELYQTEEALLLFLVRPHEPLQVVELELAADVAEAYLVTLLEALHNPVSPDTRSHQFIRAIRQPSVELYTVLIAPLADALTTVQRLIIVPHLFWHYLPFHLLYNATTGQYLLDRFEISYAPSASVLELCKKKQRTTRDSALILCRNDGDLPHVDDEGEQICGAFNNPSRYHGAEATFSTLSTMVQHDVIHCACHGSFNPDQPFLSCIAIPPDNQQNRPSLLADLLGMPLESSLVTLSACQTGLNQVSNADELVGLSRAFFSAGAASLLLSLWKVSDSSTAYLMENFYWHYVVNHQTKGRALQLAMQAVRAKQEFAHPYYWAPFVVMGEWV